MITVQPFGTTKNNQPVTLFKLENKHGSYAEILDYGATLRSLVVPDRAGVLRDVCLGFDTVAEYEENGGFFGAIIGRCANRIRGSEFSLNGKVYQLGANEGENHLHGGGRGFDKHVWNHRIEKDTLIFFRISPSGEESYPGNVAVEAHYALTDENALRIILIARSDEDTVVNLTNHAYWNLNGHGTGFVGNHTIQINANSYLPLAPDCCPTGEIFSVNESPFDLRTPTPLLRGWETECPQLKIGGGYDHNWVLAGEGFRKVAELQGDESGIAMELYTTQPGLQVYTGNTLSPMAGKNSAKYTARCAVAMEAQGFPDAVHTPAFPSVILPKGTAYSHSIEYVFHAAEPIETSSPL